MLLYFLRTLVIYKRVEHVEHFHRIGRSLLLLLLFVADNKICFEDNGCTFQGGKEMGWRPPTPAFLQF